jgi:hypothetical protein
MRQILEPSVFLRDEVVTPRHCAHCGKKLRTQRTPSMEQSNRYEALAGKRLKKYEWMETPIGHVNTW